MPLGGLPLGTHEESIFFGAIFACTGATMKGQMVRRSDCLDLESRDTLQL